MYTSERLGQSCRALQDPGALSYRLTLHSFVSSIELVPTAVSLFFSFIVQAVVIVAEMLPSNQSRDDMEMGSLIGSEDDSERSSNADVDGSSNGKDTPRPLKGGGGVLRALQSQGSLKSLSACALYSFCSVSMILVNKSLASR